LNFVRHDVSPAYLNTYRLAFSDKAAYSEITCQKSRTNELLMDRVELFRVFARVVEAASFSKAAINLGMPRSSVSAAIQELEARLGARLLNRTTRKVSPTQDGTAFYERCVRLIGDIEEVEGLFRQSAGEIAGKLRVDVPGRIGRLILIPALPEFLDVHPGIEIELGVNDRAIDLVEDAVDCALRVGPLPDSSLVMRQIGQLQLINVASSAYVEQHGLPTVPNELDDHWCVNYASPSSGRVEEWEWLDQRGLHTRPVRGKITVNSAEAYIAACLAGLGLIQIPAYDVRQQLQSGQLVELMPDYRAAPMPISLLYPSRHHLSPRLRVFTNWLEQLLQRELLTA